MSRVNYPITIDQLIAEAKKAKKLFGGDRYILISTDEEGNDFHECYFSFSAGEEMLDEFNAPYGLKPEECVTLG